MKKIICLLVVMTLLAGCAFSKQSALLFRPPQDYVSYQNISGVMIGCEAFSDEKKYEQVFGFEPRKKGIVPVQFALDNKSGQAVEIESGFLVLIDGAGGRWNALTNQEAIERIEKNEQSGEPKKKEARSVAAGTVIDLAAEIIPETRAEDMRSGSGSGVVLNTVAEAKERAAEREARIDAGLRTKGIEDRKISSGSLAHGFIYFPAEAETVRELRIRMRFIDTGRTETLSFRLR